MATSLQLTLLFVILIIYSFFFSRSTAIEDFESTFTTQAQPPVHDLPEHSIFSHTTLLGPILTHLGFHQLATVVPSLSSAAATTTSSWTGPSTLFAPSDASLRSCQSCSLPSLIREHIVPGLFTVDYLRKLAFGTKIETLSPGRCLTVTSDHSRNDTASAKIFIGGAEITHPDIFNNGLIVVHGLQGFISPLSPFSCDVERMTSLSFPFHPDRVHQLQPSVQSAIMRMMLRDAMLRLRNNGFSVLSLAMKVKYADLVSLNNMTVFTLDDVSIFTGSHAYINNVRFHIVPNRFLTIGDLEKLPVGTILPTLERGQSLLVTTAGSGIGASVMRINYVRVKIPDVMKNLKIVVHSLFLPFPHIHAGAAVADGTIGGGGAFAGLEGGDQIEADQVAEGACVVTGELGGGGACGVSPIAQVKPTVEIEGHNGL